MEIDRAGCRRRRRACRSARMPIGGMSSRVSGKLLRPIDVAVLAAAGIKRTDDAASRVFACVRARAGPDAMLDAARDLIARAVAAAGGVRTRRRPAILRRRWRTQRRRCHRHRRHRQRPRRRERAHAGAAGRVEVHGIALSPGETAAFGIVGSTAGAAGPGPHRCRARGLAHARPPHAGAAVRTCRTSAPATTVVLARKVASPLGSPRSCRCAAATARPSP